LYIDRVTLQCDQSKSLPVTIGVSLIAFSFLFCSVHTSVVNYGYENKPTPKVVVVVVVLYSFKIYASLHGAGYSLKSW
jgi:hypothetical protein